MFLFTIIEVKKKETRKCPSLILEMVKSYGLTVIYLLAKPLNKRQ